MKTASFPAVVAAKKAASAQLNYYRTMMASAQPHSSEPPAKTGAPKTKAKPSDK